MTRLRDAGTGLLYIVLVAALIALSIAIYNGDFGNVTKVSLRTDSIGSSMQKGSDVQVRGIVVGSVEGVHTDGDGARIDLDIDSSRVGELPTNVQAVLLPKTLFGERYVSLELPATPSGSHLHGGSVIEQDTSTKAVELQQVFDTLLPVLQAVQPAQLATLLGNLSQALQGRGAELGQTVGTFTSYLQEFAPKVPQLTADIASLGKVATTYAEASPDLLTALDDFTVTNQTLAANSAQLLSLFDSATSAADTIGSVVGVNEQNIIALTNQSIPTLQTLVRYSGEFPCLANALTNFIPTADKAFGVGTHQPGLRATLRIVPSLGSYAAGATRTTSYPSVCQYAPYDGQTAAAATPRSSPVDGLVATATGATTALNSPAENEVVAELVAPTMGLAPSAFPTWGSLLLGPTLRGTAVTLTGSAR